MEPHDQCEYLRGNQNNQNDNIDKIYVLNPFFVSDQNSLTKFTKYFYVISYRQVKLGKIAIDEILWSLLLKSNCCKIFKILNCRTDFTLKVIHESYHSFLKDSCFWQSWASCVFFRVQIIFDFIADVID